MRQKHAGPQLWSPALGEHGDQPEGILYRSRHDDSALCVAVYDRAKDGLAIVQDHFQARGLSTASEASEEI